MVIHLYKYYLLLIFVVRINIISPRKLADQHLLAENVEILMLASYAKNNPCLDEIPKEYCLGKGHIKFFKDKIKYLELRHELIKIEMKNRGFKANKTISLVGFKKYQLNTWNPTNKDFKIIKERIIWKIKNKPNYYNYYGKKRSLSFFKRLLDS